MTKLKACATGRHRKGRRGMHEVIFATAVMSTMAVVGSLDSARAAKSCSDMYAGCMNHCKTLSSSCSSYCSSELERCKQTGTFNTLKGSSSGLKRE
jgi:hypothetical protein